MSLDEPPPRLDEALVASLPRERAILVTVGLGALLVPLNSTMIAVALPRIIDDLGATVTAAGWLVTGYLIAMAALQPIGGKLGDRYGRRRLMLWGLVGFGVASFGAAAAPNVASLVVFRIGQAVAGAIVFPNGNALVREAVPVERRAGRYGMVGSAIALGAAAGPPLGGVLVGAGGWRAVFWANVPVLVLALALGFRAIPAVRPQRRGETFDLVGGCLLAVALASGAWVLMSLGRESSESPLLPALGIVPAVAFALFLRRELGHPDPIVQPRFFRRRAFAAATGAVALSNLSMYSVLLAVPLVLASVGGWTEARIGLVLTAMSGGMVVLAPLGGRLADRFGRRLPAVAGMLFLTGGMVVLAVQGVGVGSGALVGALFAAGVGLGLGAPALQTAAVEAVSAEHAGMAAGSYSTCRYLGSIVGTAVLAGLLAGEGGSGALFVLVTVTAAGAAILCLGLPGRATRTPSASPAPRGGAASPAPSPRSAGSARG